MKVAEKAFAEPGVAAALAAADLVYATDDEPGIRRRRVGGGFTYVFPDGSRVGDPSTLTRIRTLAIPPAYTDVWISPHPRGHLQATGRDARGRKQYRYHAEWAALRDAAKYDRLSRFGRALPELRARIRADLAGRTLRRDRIVAAVVHLLDTTLIRIGNAAYARDNSSFGLTTLLGRHVAVDGGTVKFRFKGKSGKAWNLRLSDRRIARLVRTCQGLPGQRLFQYEDDGVLQAVTSDDVNAYLREIGGEEVTSKHFRTWAATVSAATALGALEPPKSRREAARAVNTVLDRVCSRLGNTRAVCRRAYIHPRVVETFAAGLLAVELGEARRRKPLVGLDPDEAAVLAWLEADGRPAEGRPRSSPGEGEARK